MTLEYTEIYWTKHGKYKLPNKNREKIEDT